MSVKLPFILKRDPAINIPQKDQKEPSPKGRPEPHNPQAQEVPDEEQYEGHDFQQIEEQQLDPPPQPVETITVLKSQLQEPQFPNLQQSFSKSYTYTRPDLQQLQEKLKQKLQTTIQIRTSMSQKKNQIKSISDQIDKDLNKSLLKANKQKHVNIRDIFSATPSKSNNIRLNKLTQQLKAVRFNLKKIKQEIQKIQEGQADPVLLMNEERGLQLKTRIKSAEKDIKTIQHEKQLLSQQIERGGKGIDEEQEKQKAQDIQKLGQQLIDIQNSQKEEKLQLYRIEKEDIYLMEKVKYFQEREGLLGNRRQKPAQRPKEQLQQQIKQLIKEINTTVEERNKTQSDKKSQTKQLAAELTSLETKNWDLCNRLRQIDAFLLQYYEKKTRKKEAKAMEKTIDIMQNSLTGKTSSQGFISQNLNKSKVFCNDKNFQSVEVLVEKKKVYQFGVREAIQGEITLSDQFLGPKIILQSVFLECSQARIHRIFARYKNQKGAYISGLVMGNKDLPEGAVSLNLELKGDEVINFIHTGYDQNKQITFIHFVTSQGHQLKWGSLQQLVKSQQKHIKKYETSFFKAKLIPSIDQSKQSFRLAGIVLATTYNSPK